MVWNTGLRLDNNRKTPQTITEPIYCADIIASIKYKRPKG